MSNDVPQVPVDPIPWLVSAKVVPPRKNSVLAERSAILDRLSGHQERRATILEAPGGFGKSTLLALWRSRLLQTGDRVAWLTLCAEDTGGTLVTYLAYALHMAGLDVSNTGLLANNNSASDDSLYNLNLLIGAIQTTGDNFTLILDDVEFVAEEEAVQVLNVLFRHAPENLHLAVAFRRNPGLLLSNLLLDGAAIRLTAEEMRFSAEEVEAFFDHTLSQADMQTVLDRTEGWPVALRLIRGGRAGGGFDIERIRLFSGERGLAAEYFAEQVFARLSESEQKFLLDVSVLEWLEVPLIDAIRETEDADRMLDGLSHLEGVIVSLDAQEEVYRLHALFREFLLNTLQRDDIRRYMDLQRRAARILADKGRLLTALRHANLAGDNQLFGEILEQAGGITIWFREGMTRVYQAVKLMDNEILKLFPRIAFLKCVVLMKEGHMNEAQSLFNRLEEETEGFHKDREGGDDAALYQEHIFVRSTLAAYGCRTLDDEMLSVLTDENPEPGHRVADATTLAHHKTLLCLANQQKADFKRAWRIGREGIEHFKQINSIYGELFMDFHFGSIAMAQGEPHDAEAHYARAQKYARKYFPRDGGIQLVGDILMAELDLERNLLKRLKRKLNNIIQRLHDSEAWFDIYAAAYSVVVEMILEEEGAEDAQAFLREAFERAEEQGLTKVSIFLAVQRVAIQLSQGQLEQAGIMYEKFALPREAHEIFDMSKYSWREAEIIAITLLQLHISAREFDEGRALLAAFLEFTEQKSLVRSRIRALVLGAVLEKAAGQGDMALEFARRAVEQIKFNDYIRPFVRFADQIGSLLHRLAANAGDEDMKVQLDKLIAQLKIARETSDAGEFFSHREIEILRGLERGFQDKVIAKALNVTPHAVRYHLKNIYAKTNASNRIQALNKAKKMGAFTTQG
ncbi:LuxR C-terminal-related transcriptional regulator [Emcibacter sp.]|uniref:LuxR C-terminal-related transcriptional regulator n=1 Tax=Emcibacter sp. TaxID=1979954 RepID=UPI002AA92D7A|nr:LuxR C-terminal-related transcriptional regulator [Emcibacter sp.]